MNKRAQFFEQVLVLIVFLLCVIATILFVYSNRQITQSISEVYPAVTMFSNSEKESFYAEDAGKIAIQKSYLEIAPEIGAACPRAQENVNYAIWARECLSKNNEISKKFIERVNFTLNDLGVRMNSISIDNGIIHFKGIMNFSSSIKKPAEIKVDYSKDISFSKNLSNYSIYLDFEKIYEQLFSRIEFCKNPDASKVSKCISEIKIQGWQILVRNDELFCDLTSDGQYYSDGKLSSAVIKFKLNR